MKSAFLALLFVVSSAASPPVASQEGRVSLAEAVEDELPAPETEKDPVPFYQDDFSGRTVEDIEMAAGMVEGRFFNAPCRGEKAPGFVVTDLATGKSVLLADLHSQRPVVLFFGSFGCDVMRGSVSKLLEVYEEYKEDFDFAMIYIREAHALDGFAPERGRILDPKTYGQRADAAELCREGVGIPFRILVDSMDDRVATRWAAWPIRLYVVDTDGMVAYAGRPGPWGFSPGRGYKAEHADDVDPHPERFNQESLEDFLKAYREKAGGE